MNAQNCHCTDDFRGHAAKSLSTRHRIAWREAIARFASPMVRLHRLRNLRTQMLHEALCDIDGCKQRGEDA